jgi:TDG/mug DNA glycosylase family protein
VDERTKKLILGEFPGKKSMHKEQYYADGRNDFWKIMGSILDFDHKAEYDYKIEKPLENKIGLWDIESCGNFQPFFDEYPSICKVLLNGESLRERYQETMNCLTSIDRITVIDLPNTSGANRAKYPKFEEKQQKWLVILNDR